MSIISLSANSLDSDIKESRNAGINFYLGKPINPDCLKNVILLYRQKISNNRKSIYDIVNKKRKATR